jgi:hypothetical protein
MKGGERARQGSGLTRFFRLREARKRLLKCQSKRRTASRIAQTHSENSLNGTKKKVNLLKELLAENAISFQNIHTMLSAKK